MFYATSIDEPNSSRGGLAFNGATIQIWRRVIGGAFGGPVSSNRQRPLLLDLAAKLCHGEHEFTCRIHSWRNGASKTTKLQLNYGADEPSLVTHGLVAQPIFAHWHLNKIIPPNETWPGGCHPILCFGGLDCDSPISGKSCFWVTVASILPTKRCHFPVLALCEFDWKSDKQQVTTIQTGEGALYTRQLEVCSTRSESIVPAQTPEYL